MLAYNDQAYVYTQYKPNLISACDGLSFYIVSALWTVCFINS